MNSLTFTRDELIGLFFLSLLVVSILSFVAGNYYGYLTAKDEEDELNNRD